MVDVERNNILYDCFEGKCTIKEAALKTGDSINNINTIIKKIEKKKMTRDFFIKTFRKFTRLKDFKGEKDAVQESLPPMNLEPKYQKGEIIQEKYKILEIYKDKINRYLVMVLPYGYKTMFFENDLKED